jgi:hemolysin activation/secretion protein
MEATLMNLVGFLGTAVLSLTLVAAAPVYAQEQHEQQEEKGKPAQQEEKKAQQEKPEAQQQKNNKPEEKQAQQEKREPTQQAQRGGGGRIPEDRFKANFGQEHRFHVNQADYNNGRRFQYSGYWFTFVDPWPSNWLYTQDVFVVEINGVYYLCNPMYPGVNITLGFSQ